MIATTTDEFLSFDLLARHSHVILKRLYVLVERVHPESQWDFHASRSTIYVDFMLRQLLEKCQEQAKSLYMAFMDHTKAFDLVSRMGLFRVLERIVYSTVLLSLIQSVHDGMKATIQWCQTEMCFGAYTLLSVYYSLSMSSCFLI